MARKEIDHFRAVAIGLVPGWDIANRFGRNPDVDATAAREDIWNGGGLYTGFPEGNPSTIAEALRLTSTSTEDAPGGTGMRTVRLYGLDANGISQTEDVTLNGTTPVVTTKTWYRMNQVIGLTSGTNGGVVGTLTIQHNVTTANVFSVLSPPQCCSHIAAFTVPADKNGLLTTVDVAASNNQVTAQEIVAALAIRPFGQMFTHRYSTYVSTASPAAIRTVGGQPLDPLTDFIVRVTSATADNLSVSAKFEIFTSPVVWYY